MRTTILVLCVGVFGLLSGTPFTMATGDITEKKAEPAKLESLEKMQAQALQNNLDIKLQRRNCGSLKRSWSVCRQGSRLGWPNFTVIWMPPSLGKRKRKLDLSGPSNLAKVAT